MRSALIIAAVTVATTSAVADTRPLVEAVAEASDPVAVARAARLLSGRELVEMIGTNRADTRAAVFAAPFNPEAVALLPRLSDVAAGFDRSLAVPAARAAAEIAAGLDGAVIAEREIPRRALAEAAIAWHRVARDRSLWADVRVSALEVSRDLTRLLTGDGTRTAVELIADPDPELRRAALELLDSPLPAARHERVAARLLSERVDEIAVAAAAALCSGARFGDDMAPVREAVGEKGLARIGELATDDSLSAAARFAAAGCLTDPDIRRAIAGSLPAHLRSELEARPR